MSLESQYRLLARAFPPSWRRRHGDDLVATMLDASATDQRMASPSEALDVVRAGVLLRIRAAGPLLSIAAATVVLAATVAVVHLTLTPTSVSFLVTSLVVVVIPGTGVIFSVSTALSSGWRRGSIAAVGCTLGIVPHLLAASVGLSGLMQASAEAFEVVRWLGVAYLAHLGLGMIRSTGDLSGIDGGQASMSAAATIRRGVLLNLLNPKLTIFFFAFLPQFLASPPTLLDLRLLGLSGVFMAMTLAIFLFYAAFAAGVRERILATPRLLRRIEQSLGLVLLGFATRLALAER